MTSKLSRVRQELAHRLDPKIETTANPRPDWLLQARADVNSDPTLQALFRDAKAEGQSPEWLADMVSSRLMGRWEGESPDQAIEAARYLADEYFQVGEGIHIVSTETGRIVATVTEDDIYQPAPLPREGGGMAQPLPRLDPNLEAFITTWTFEAAREDRILMALVEKGQRAIAFDDPRLQPATRAGRSQIVRDVAEMTPESLLRGTGGTSAAFLQHFDLRTVDWESPRQTLVHGAEPDLEGCIEAKSVLHIGDQTTINPHHDRRSMLRGVLPQGWAREMARLLADEAHKRTEVQTLDLSEVPIAGLRAEATFWVIPPEAIREFVKPLWTILPVERAKVIGLQKPKVGTLVVPEQFAAASHELFERWETVADLDFKMWVDWDAITCLDVTGLEYQAHVV